LLEKALEPAERLFRLDPVNPDLASANPIEVRVSFGVSDFQSASTLIDAARRADIDMNTRKRQRSATNRRKASTWSTTAGPPSGGLHRRAPISPRPAPSPAAASAPRAAGSTAG
jgi:hypothetical protein